MDKKWKWGRSKIEFYYVPENYPHGFSVGYLTPAGWL